MKKIDSYWNFKRCANGTAEFRFKYVDGKTDDFRIKQEILGNFVLTVCGEDSTFVLKPDMRPNWRVLQNDASGRIAIMFDFPDRKSMSLLLEKESAAKLGTALLTAGATT